MDKENQPTKPEVVRLLLEQEGRVMLCVDATRPGVEVPRRHARDKGLRLILNSSMPQPIHIGPFTIESELRFGGVPHHCIIPYHALWGAFNPNTGHGLFWEEAMPPRIREEYHQMSRLALEEAAEKEVSSAAGDGEPAPEAPPPPPPVETREQREQREPPRLQVIEGNGAEPESPEPTPPRRPPLRLVK